MSHGGGEGVRKGPKKCNVLFEWPLITISIYDEQICCLKKSLEMNFLTIYISNKKKIIIENLKMPMI